jgi:hypothetical protein
MPLTRLLAAAAVSALLAGPALAQSQPMPKTMDEAVQPPPAPAANQAATPASTLAVDPNAPAVILQSSPTPPDQAYRLKAGDPSVVSNGPVPDTAENRAKYGAPLSNGGRQTTPAGN